METSKCYSYFIFSAFDKKVVKFGALKCTHTAAMSSQIC